MTTTVEGTSVNVPMLFEGVERDSLGEATFTWLANKSRNTRTAYGSDLRAWMAFCAQRDTHPLAARKQDADLFGAWMTDETNPDRVSTSSAARRMAAVSSWYRYLVACDTHDRNPFAAAERPRVDRDYSATAWLEQEQAAKLLAYVDGRMNETGLRDAAVIRVMLQVGVRVSEVCTLPLAALGAARGQRTLLIVGKGGKRIVRALPAETAAAIDTYLDWRARQLDMPRTRLTGYLFTTRSGAPLQRCEVFRLVRKMAICAGLDSARSITPHALRHTFATIATERGADLDDLQDAMGHADPRTTRRYQRAARRLEKDPAHLVAAALG